MANPSPDQYHLFHGQAASAIEPAAPSVLLRDGDQQPLKLCVLGSGSSGNCSMIDHQGQLLLIDAGFGPRTIARRMLVRDAVFSQVKAICITHLDSDHFQSHLIPTLIKWGITLYIHESHMPAWWRIEKSREFHEAGLLRVFTSRAFSPLEGLSLRSIRLAHDRKGSYGFRIESAAGHIGYATDLGHVPDGFVEHFSGVDVLAIESNYDPHMQLASMRPYRLKHRVMGGHGHLSNQQCLDAIRAIRARCARQQGPRSIVLLHRSRQCNCPNLLRQMYATDPHLHERLHLSEQDTPSPWIVTRADIPAG